MSSLLSFDQLHRDPQKLLRFPFTKAFCELIWKYPVTEIGQWHFSADELELLTLYLRAGVVGKFQEYCLIPCDKGFLTKGLHYFKEYSKHYGPKLFFSFLEDLLGLMGKVHAFPFEEEDRPLQWKALLAIAEEIFNHLAWGVYLSYEAASLSQGLSAVVTPQEMGALQKGMLLAAGLYLSFLDSTEPDLESLGREISAAFQRGDTFRFIATLAGKVSHGGDSAFFRVRVGGHELSNAVHAYAVKSFLAAHGLSLDGVVAPFYGGLTSAALGYAALRPLFPHLEYLVHGEYGTWEKVPRREILARLSQVPPLVRPSSGVAGKSLLIVGHALEDGNLLRSLKHYYEELGAKAVYLTTVAAASQKLDLTHTPMCYQGLELHIPPTFEAVGLTPWRHHHKYVEQWKGQTSK